MSKLPLAFIFPRTALTTIALGLALGGACGADPPVETGAESGEVVPVDGVCEPRACDSTCGEIADGCGDSIFCGECSTDVECEPQTCDEASCGEQGDGCGGELNCGECAKGDCEGGVCFCGEDSLEPSDDENSAHDFATWEESSGHLEWVEELVITGGEEDWFKVEALDTFSLGNPRVGFGVSAVESTRDLRLSVSYVCNSGNKQLACVGGSFDQDLNACVTVIPTGTTEQWMHVIPDCGGLFGDEDGVAFARITAVCADSFECDTTCETYDLGVEVTK